MQTMRIVNLSGHSHLFFKIQRGEIDNQIWLGKGAEIKAIVRYIEEILKGDE